MESSNFNLCIGFPDNVNFGQDYHFFLFLNDNCEYFTGKTKQANFNLEFDNLGYM